MSKIFEMNSNSKRRNQLFEGWGMELYRRDPDIYHPWYDAMHRGKAAHHLMVKIFEYCKEKGWIKKGDNILDPFGGSGRTGIVGSMLGYGVSLIEIEPMHARKTVPANINYARAKLTGRGNINELETSKKAEEGTLELGLTTEHTSTNGKKHRFWAGDPIVIEGDARCIEAPDNTFDAVITSPPYADQIDTNSTEATIRALGKTGAEPSSIGTLTGYGKVAGQIGVLRVGTRGRRKESYEEAMEKVYREVARVLKPGGILVTIIKDGIKNEKRLPINRINRQLIYQTGLTLIDAKLAEVHAPKANGPDLFGNPGEPQIAGHRVSYFRRFHYKKNPRVLIRYEHVCFYQKAKK